MADEERAGDDEPTWIELDRADATRRRPQGGRRWIGAVVAVVVAVALIGALVVLPDDGRPDEEVSSASADQDEQADRLFGLTVDGDLVELSATTGETERVLVEEVVEPGRPARLSASPDRSAILVGYTSHDAPPVISRVDVADGAVEPVAEGWYPALSPDGRTLASIPYDQGIEGPPLVRLVDLDDESAAPVDVPIALPALVSGGRLTDLAWAPGPDRLYVAASDGAASAGAIVDARSGADVSDVWHGTGDADAPRPAAFLDDVTLAIVDPTGAEPGRVVGVRLDEGPTGTPPSTSSTAPVGVAGTAPTTAPLGTVAPPPVTAPTSELRTLFAVDGSVSALAVPPSGGAVSAVVTTEGDPEASRLVHWTPDEGVVELASGVTAVAWGPPAEATPESTTVPPTTDATVPRGSSDGPAIVAITRDGDLVALDPDDGAPQRTIATGVVDVDEGGRWFGGGRELDLVVSPDGSTVFVSDPFAARGDPVIEAIDVATGERTIVANGLSPAISPDGTTLAYAEEHGVDPAVVHVLDLDSGRTRTLEIAADLWADTAPALDQSLWWRSDGEALYFSTGEHGGGAFADVDDPDRVEQVWAIGDLPDDLLTRVVDDGVLVAHSLSQVDAGTFDVATDVVLVPIDDLIALQPGRPLESPEDASDLVDAAVRFTVPAQVSDLDASADGETIIAVLGDDDEGWTLVRWTPDDGVVELATDLVAAAWAPRLRRSDASPPTTVPSTTVPSTTVPPFMTVPGQGPPDTTVPPPPATATTTAR